MPGKVGLVAAKGAGRLQPVPVIEPNLRRLRAYVAVSEFGSLGKAAERLNVTQSSLTRVIQALERQVGFALFKRTARGMISNSYGAILAERARHALGHLDSAEAEVTAARQNRNQRGGRGFGKKATYRQLCALVAIADYQTQTGAARKLDLSQPAVTLALRDLERLVGERLFLRTARGMVATKAGEILCRYAKLAFAEIAAAGTEIAAQTGRVSGRIVVGVLPLSGTLLAPRAINLLLRDHPSLQMTVVDGTYQSQIHGLLCGDIDVIVGGLDYEAPQEIVQESLFEDWLSVVARKDHPLFKKKSLTLKSLAGFEWVVPPGGTPARISFENVMASAGLTIGNNPIVANASPVRGLLVDSDRLAVMSRHQIYFEETAGLLAVLPIRLPNTGLPVGIRTRADVPPSAAVNALKRHLRVLSVDMRKVLN